MFILTPNTAILRVLGSPGPSRMCWDSQRVRRDDDSAHRKDHLGRIVRHDEKNFPKQSILISTATCLPPRAGASPRLQLLFANIFKTVAARGCRPVPESNMEATNPSLMPTTECKLQELNMP